MIRYYCDACKKEVKHLYKFEYLCHISQDSSMGYADSDGNAVSGRSECEQLCIGCYNKVFRAAYTEFTKITPSA